MNRKQKKLLKSYLKYEDFLIEDLKENPKEAELYLKSALKEYQEHKDDRVLLLALNHIAKVRGISAVAKDTHLTRQTIHRALSPKGNPRFSTLTSIIHSLGYSLTFRHIRTNP